MLGQVFGTCKVKDGLYIGDEFAAKDLEFIVANKVGYIVNCSSDALENLFEGVGVMYFSFQWPEQAPELVVQAEFIGHVSEFIEESVAQGQSCLIASQHGHSRACSLVAIYLMQKYRWGLYKTLEFLNSRRNDLEIKTSFFQVLTQVEVLLGTDGLSRQWEITPRTTEEERIIINTFLNSQARPVDAIYTQEEEFQRINGKATVALIKFRDQHVQVKQNPSHTYKSIVKGSKAVFYKDGWQQSVIVPAQAQATNNRLKPTKSVSVNKENQPDIGVKKPAVSQKNSTRSSSIPKAPPSQKRSVPKSGNQVVYPVKILRPRMPNFDNL